MMNSPLLKLNDQADKTKALKALLLELKKSDKAEDSVIAQRSGSFIVAVFSTAITIAGLTTVPPVMAGALIGACIAGAGGTLATLAHEFLHRTTSHKELLAVLSSKDVKQWVKLWERSGDTELFVSALEYACQGELREVGGREVFRHDDGRHPFDVACQWILDSPEGFKAATQSQPPLPVEQVQAHAPTHSLEQPTAPATEKVAPLTPDQSQPRLSDLRLMPLNERAIALLKLLEDEQFNLSRCIREQITCICGNQRGGKGTLMAILAVLSKAIDPDTKIHYFTAGDDVYPFKCDRLVCRLSYANLDGNEADSKVAQELFEYLKEMDKQTQGACKDNILVIDEAVALSDYLDPDQKQWMIRFLLTRANKKGAQIFVVLHGANLTSWVGTGNAGGFSQTFKTGATFIGCEASSKKTHPLRSISVATGRYFLATPDDFSKPLPDGELGTLPDWMKSEINPSTGQPDPARTLLNFFPELRNYGPVPAVQQTVATTQTITKVQPEAGAIASTEPTTELKVSDSLGEPLKTIWLFAKKKNDWVTVRNVYDQKFKVLEGKKVDQIHQYLGLLADTGLGEIDEQGKSHSPVGFRAY